MKKIIIFLLGILLVVIPSTMVQANNRQDEEAMLYGIGSVSKLVTASAIMRLVDMGLVDLDEPIITYMPDFTMNDPRYVYITPRMLLDHSAGFMGTVWGNAFLAGDDSTCCIEGFLDMISRQRLIHPPGERSIYNNDGFTVAEILVAASAIITAFIVTNANELYGGIDNSIVFRPWTHNTVKRCPFSISGIVSHIDSKATISKYISFLIINHFFDKLYMQIFSRVQADPAISFDYLRSFDFDTPDCILAQKGSYIHYYEV